MAWLNMLPQRFRKKQNNSEHPSAPRYDHEFLVFGVPQDKYGRHTVLVYHQPKHAFRKTVAIFGRMEEAIANAELLGEIPLPRPYPWRALEHAVKPSTQMERAGKEPLEACTKGLEGDGVVPVAVYLAKITTNRSDLLFDGETSSLPEGYLTFYTR